MECGEAGFIIHLQQLQAAVVGFRNRTVLPVNMVDRAALNFHRSHPWGCEASPGFSGRLWSGETLPPSHSVSKLRNWSGSARINARPPKDAVLARGDQFVLISKLYNFEQTPRPHQPYRPGDHRGE